MSNDFLIRKDISYTVNTLPTYNIQELKNLLFSLNNDDRILAFNIIERISSELLNEEIIDLIDFIETLMLNDILIDDNPQHDLEIFANFIKIKVDLVTVFNFFRRNVSIIALCLALGHCVYFKRQLQRP